MSDNIPKAIWERIKDSVKAGNLADIIKIYKEKKLSYNAKCDYSRESILHLATTEGKSDILKYFIEQGADIDSENYSGCTPLLTAASDNNIPVAQLLLEHQANVDSKNHDGDNSLLTAATANYMDLAQLLLVHKAEVDTQNKNGETPLLVAAEKNRVKLAELFIKHGANVNNKGNAGDTPLSIAALKNNVEVAQLLLDERNTNINSINGDGNSPLLIAATANNMGLAQLLLDHKAEVDTKNNDGHTSLWLAAQKGHADVARLLFDRGADASTLLLKAAREDNLNVIDLLIQLGANVDTRNDDGDTPLWIAALMNHLEVAQLLFDRGADVSIVLLKAAREDSLKVIQLLIQLGANVDTITRNDDGDTPLWIAALMSHLQVAELLFNHGADVAAPLLRAARENNVKVFKILIELGADVNTKSDEGDTLLWIVTEKKHVEIAQFLLNREADVAVPLLRAAHENNIKITKLLIELGADVDSKGGDGSDTPLWIAAQKNHVEIAQLLFKHGADVVTVIFRAAHENNVKIVQLSIELGADVDSKDDNEVTVLMKAAQNKQVEIAHLLLKKGADISVRDKTGTTTLFYIQQNMSSNDIKEVFRESPEVWELPDPAAIVEDVEIREEYDSDLKSILNSLLSQAIDKLPSVLDDPKQRFVFYRGNLYKRLITIFLDRGGEDVDILRTIYIALQAKINCNNPKIKTLRNFLDSELYQHFYEKMKSLAMRTENEQRIKLIARKIYREYLCEKNVRGFFSKVKSCMSGFCCPTRRKVMCQTMRGFFSKVKSCMSTFCCPTTTSKYCGILRRKIAKKFRRHTCLEQRYFEFMWCFLAIFIYVLDLYTDIVVGVQDYEGFSQKLGLFEICLVFFTLCHENFRSSESVYTTEEELLRIKFGRFDLKAEDWEKSCLQWSDNRYIRAFYKLCWPFKVWGIPGKLSKLKAIFYNILTWLQLRPVVDRLQVLLHAPISLREFYRRKAEQNSLKQFYLILEQLPELLVQFYTFQMMYNIIPLNELQDNSDTCYHYFEYKRISDSINATHSFCDDFSLSDDGLETCGMVFRLFSMAIPFFNIPLGIVSLEKGFRKLDPLTSEMSYALSVIFRSTFMLMIPARVFMFASVMHALYDKEYVIGYIVVRVFLELTSNLYSVKDYLILAYRKGSLGKLASILWRLILFSIRDVFAISIRDPAAYLSKPSEVSYTSLRSWENLAVRAVPFICEGLIGALLIQQRYPCGKHSYYFKYLGWFCVIPLLLSLSALVMISDLYHPLTVLKTRCSSPNKYPKKALLIGLVSVSISGIAALAFSISQPRTVVQLRIMGMVIFINIVFNTVLFLYHTKSTRTKELDEDAPVPELVPLTLSGQESAQRQSLEQSSETETEKDTERSRLLSSEQVEEIQSRDHVEIEIQLETDNSSLFTDSEDNKEGGVLNNSLKTST